MIKQLVTIDSSEIGTDAMELMTSVVARMIFDYRKCKSGESRQQNPIHLILDEAHRYIRKDADYIMRENIFDRRTKIFLLFGCVFSKTIRTFTNGVVTVW